MHGKILCVSLTENGGNCANDYELVEKLECDYIGDNVPSATEEFVAKILGECFEWHPFDKPIDDDCTCQGYLMVTENTKKNLEQMWEKFQKDVARYSFDEASRVCGDYFPFLELFNVRCSDHLIEFCGRIQSVFSFVADADRFHKGQKLYVTGCVDFHF